MKRRLYLTPSEIEVLLESSKSGNHGVRNHCMIFMAFRHGFRISELLSLRINDIDLVSCQMHVKRLKNGFSTIHPFDTEEQAVISSWLKVRETYSLACQSDFLFLTDRNINLSRKQAWWLIKTCGIEAKISVPVHPHMLRHACGYTLANQGADTRLIQDYLGHRNIRHTVHYTKGNPERFARLFNNIVAV